MRAHSFHEWPLVFFTTLTQLAVGAFLLWGLPAALLSSPPPFITELFAVVILGISLTALLIGGLAASVHLGRPLGAVFSLNNWRTSWLSREAILSVGFGLLVASTLVLRFFAHSFGLLDRLLILAGCICGLGLVLSIAQLYRLRTVPAWNNLGTPLTFLTTSFLTGSAAFMLIWHLLSAADADFTADPIFVGFEILSNQLILLLVGLQALIFAATLFYLKQHGRAGSESVAMLASSLRRMLVWRWVIIALGVTLLLFSLTPPYLFLPYLLVLTSEVLGRYLYYSFYQRTGY